VSLPRVRPVAHRPRSGDPWFSSDEHSVSGATVNAIDACAITGPEAEHAIHVALICGR
jgi:hypothetical protein